MKAASPTISCSTTTAKLKRDAVRIIARSGALLPMLDSFAFNEPSIVLTQHCELARFAPHCCMPHMRCVHRDKEIHAVVLLKYRKYLRIFRVWVWALRLKTRVELKCKSGRRKEHDELEKFIQGNGGVYLPQGYETFYVGLEDRPLVPRA